MGAGSMEWLKIKFDEYQHKIDFYVGYEQLDVKILEKDTFEKGFDKVISTAKHILNFQGY